MKTPILLVDDDPDDLVALQATLAPLDVEVFTADCGEEALRMLLRRDFAMVVMDLMMPRLNGFEACALIRQRDRCRDLPIVILTGFDEEGARGVAGYGAAGRFELLRKPVDPEELRAAVARHTVDFRPGVAARGWKR